MLFDRQHSALRLREERDPHGSCRMFPHSLPPDSRRLGAGSVPQELHSLASLGLTYFSIKYGELSLKLPAPASAGLSQEC